MNALIELILYSNLFGEETRRPTGLPISYIETPPPNGNIVETPPSPKNDDDLGRRKSVTFNTMAEYVQIEKEENEDDADAKENVSKSGTSTDAEEKEIESSNL